jgi:hypothetical protein
MIVSFLFLIQNKMKRLPAKSPAQKKGEVSKRIDALDPNNNKNLPQNPVIRKRGKKLRDDGFEHRLSKETT